MNEIFPESHCEIIQADYDARTYGASVSWTMADYRRLGDHVKPALKPGGHCLMVLDAPVRAWRKGYGTERGFLPWHVMLDWAERVGLRVPDRLAYGRMGTPGKYLGRFRNDWEPLLWFQRSGADTSFFNRWSLARKVKPFAGRLSSNRRPDGWHRRYTTGKAAAEGWAHRGNLWQYGNVGHGHDTEGEDTGHPARFFSGFAEDAVRCFCPPAGLVCDPFTGSGTSAVAAIKHGRRFLGGDLLNRQTDGKPWADIAMDRVRQAAAQMTRAGEVG
jgi:hypothetical protein